MWLNIKSEYSSAAGEFDGFVKVVSGGETDQRVDVAAELLTKLITVNEKILDEIKVIGVEMNETRKELTNTHEDLKGAITESHDAVVSEIRDLRFDLKENFEGRLIRMESDVSQIKARIGL